MFSQNSEEDIIINQFRNMGGVFLDIGANDGVSLSNTYGLALGGWEGVCIEPSITAFAKLSETYRGNSKITLLKCAIGGKGQSGNKIFYESGTHLGKGDTSLLSSLNESEIEKWANSTEFKKTVVKVIDFEEMMALVSHKWFDFISIDTEGNDLIILKQMDLNMLQTSCVCVEWNGKNKDQFDEIMLPKGFSLIHTNLENLIYAK